tara:strand:+ start:1207 stop:1851 length:645 start_codon:yes stop_codon:yes gene_type:complete
MCNAIENVLGTRTVVGFTKKQVVATERHKKVIVGFAKTAKIRAASPPLITKEEVDKNRANYYEYIVANEKYPLVVLEDTDYPNTVGAFWGELNVAIHKGLGIKGTLTNGLVRDLDMLDEGYQVIAGGVGPSHAFVHVTELDVNVNIFGLQISPGDFIHADQHGAMSVPQVHLEAMPEALRLVTERETPILDAARRKDFSLEKLKRAMEESKKIC